MLLLLLLPFILTFVLLNIFFIKGNFDLTLHQSQTQAQTVAAPKEIVYDHLHHEKEGNQEFTKERIPRIFWIYTDNELEGEPHIDQTYWHYHKAVAAKLGYEVRVVNSWTAYDYLSDFTSAKISKIMQRSKVDQSVHPLLKLALLIENGGIMVNKPDTAIFGSSLDWLQ